MALELNTQQQAAQAGFRRFMDEHVAPFADEFDRREETPAALVAELARCGQLGGLVPPQYGGAGMDAITWGLLCEEVGRASGSLLSLFTVHGMVAQAVQKWGTAQQREQWLPRLASGASIGAFGLTEPGAGSDASHGSSTAVQDGDDWVLNGEKCWISFAQIATLFLIVAQVEGKLTAFLVERDTPGLQIEPLSGMSGFRSAMLGRILLKDCRIPAANLVGRVGFGFSHVAGTALDHGRYSIAWGCVGLSQAALDASLAYAGQRKTFGVPLVEHQLIQGMLADMITEVRAARLLCLHASALKEARDPALIMETSIAKYFASRTANLVAGHAVQIHGAQGCTDRSPVQRYLRDAKIMDIIEGSNQIQQILISRHGYRGFVAQQNARNKTAQG
ncbi:acyl-CoA dehydrogenase family protein [Delftia sp. PS-11]|uniref:acyl-CoA dehydrogenase family protein n=1 Tax=Delftia sp. PS-11 TaxID=2767222 RepID=UPI0024584FEC|nr:acyl-CoA dehydrogenase family protein [Delftia sp. PS-11]KAJ8744937.1 acyl-CoA dehydrogenase family protein [Delftia sp. PS-11]